MNLGSGEIGAAAGVVGALFAASAWWRNHRLNRQDKHLSQQDEKLQEIHVLVNSRLTTAIERIATLEEALSKATGIPKEIIEEKPPLAEKSQAP